MFLGTAQSVHCSPKRYFPIACVGNADVSSRAVLHIENSSRASRCAPSLPDQGVLLFATVRNEALRLPYWLAYYRALGVTHVLIVDNDSTDGISELLAGEIDVSVWSAKHSYKASRYGVDWLTCLQFKYGHGRWCLTVDADEALVYPGSNDRSLNELRTFLDRTVFRLLGR